jgi:hypothetical protein
LRVSACHRLDQAFQVLTQLGVLHHRFLASASCTADPPFTDSCPVLKLLDALTDGLAGESCRSRHRGDPSPPYHHGLTRCEQPPRPLIEFPDQQIESLLDGFFSFIHAPQSTTLCPALIPLFSDDSLAKSHQLHFTSHMYNTQEPKNQEPVASLFSETLLRRGYPLWWRKPWRRDDRAASKRARGPPRTAALTARWYRGNR